MLEACAPRLKVISKWGTGVDSIDADACSRYGIKLCRTPNAFTLPVADSVLSYILAFARRQPWMSAYQSHSCSAAVDCALLDDLIDLKDRQQN